MAIFDRVQLLARAPSPAPDPRTPVTERADVPFAAVADCLNRGLLLARRGEHAAALAVYGKALALAPRQGEIYLCRGMAHFACGALNDAIADFNMALYYAPGLSSALAERGRASLTLGNPRAAVIDCTAALCVNPRNLRAYLVRAEAHAAAGDEARAAADYQAHLRLAGLPQQIAPSVN